MRTNKDIWVRSRAKRVSRGLAFTLRMTFSAGLALTLMFTYWWYSPQHIGNMLLFLLFSLFFAYTSLRLLFTWYVYMHVSAPEKAKAPEGLRVAIFTTSYKGEPLSMIEKTLAACANVSYPHTTYLLDNTGDPAFRAAAERLGAVWLDMDNTAGAKAGKINKALSLTNEEFILVLDPDHMPFPSFFDETLGYFTDPAVGFVQVSQGYYNQYRSFVAKGAAEQSYFFYGPMQMAYSAMGTAIAIGANCTFRREALESIGGHVVGLAEDLQTSLKLHSAGWKSVYNPVVVNRGIVPEDFDSYAKQQLKWARGAFDVLFDDLPRAFKKLTFKQRLIYISIATYYLNGFVTFFFVVFPFVYLLTGLVPVNMPMSEFLFFGLLYIILSVAQYLLAGRFLCHHREKYIHWRAMILNFASWPIYFYAFILALSDKKIPYIPTAKTVGTQLPVFIRPHWAYLGLFAVSVVGVIVYRFSVVPIEQFYQTSILLWCMVAFAGIAAVMSLLAILFTKPPIHLAGEKPPWDEIEGFEIKCNLRERKTESEYQSEAKASVSS